MSGKLKKSILLFVLIAVHLSLAQARLVEVSSSTQLKDAVKYALAGDSIVVENGVYNTGTSLTLKILATADKPVYIKAKEIGKVELTGDTYFDLRKCAYVTIEGFLFTSTDNTVIKTQASHHIRITRNTFRLKETESLKWVIIQGIWDDPYAPSHHNRIDHNLFEEKHQLGNFITIDGQADPVYQSSQYDRIDHNHFRNIGPRAENEMEAVRVGWSEMSTSSGYTTIEYNLFENCDGDPEIISVKTCDDTVRYNTFVSSQGTVSLRHGNRSVVAGNFFFGNGKEGTGGVRLYGDDHKIYNNYFEGLTGTRWDAPLTLTNGDYDSGTSYSKHFRINRALIVHNTLVDNRHHIEIGYDNNGTYSKPPRDVTIANNIVTGRENQLVKVINEPVNMSWIGNILFTDSLAEQGFAFSAEQAINSDPGFNWIDGLWKISDSSTARDAASTFYDFVNEDMDGQLRTEPDLGADEYALSDIVHMPMTSEMVGPGAEDLTTLESEKQSQVLKNVVLEQNYPNPFNPITTIEYRIPVQSIVSIDIFNVLGRRIKNIVNENHTPGSYSIQLDATNLASGAYFYRLWTNSFIKTRKMLLLK